jgi:hypothetical protein
MYWGYERANGRNKLVWTMGRCASHLHVAVYEPPLVQVLQRDHDLRYIKLSHAYGKSTGPGK